MSDEVRRVLPVRLGFPVAPVERRKGLFWGSNRPVVRFRKWTQNTFMRSAIHACPETMAQSIKRKKEWSHLLRSARLAQGKCSSFIPDVASAVDELAEVITRPFCDQLVPCAVPPPRASDHDHIAPPNWSPCPPPLTPAVERRLALR